MNTAKKVIEKYGGPTKFHRLTGIPLSTLHDRVHGKIKNPSVVEQICWELLAVAPEGFIRAASKLVAE